MSWLSDIGDWASGLFSSSGSSSDSSGWGGFLGNMFDSKNVGSALSVGGALMANNDNLAAQNQAIADSQAFQMQKMAQEQANAIEFLKLKASLGGGGGGGGGAAAQIAAQKALARYNGILNSYSTAMGTRSGDAANVARAYGTLADTTTAPLRR